MHKIKLLLKEDSIKTRSGDYLIIYRPANLAIFVLVIRNGKNQNFYAKDDFNGRLIYLSKLNYAPIYALNRAINGASCGHSLLAHIPTWADPFLKPAP